MKLIHEELKLKYENTYVFHNKQIVYIENINSEVVKILQSIHATSREIISNFVELPNFSFQSWIPYQGFYPHFNGNMAMCLSRTGEKSASKSFEPSVWRVSIPSINDSDKLIETKGDFAAKYDLLNWANSLRHIVDNRGRWNAIPYSEMKIKSFVNVLHVDILACRKTNNLINYFYKDTLFAVANFNSLKNQVYNFKMVEPDLELIVNKLIPWSLHCG